ncbi:unnamed protein product, partial [Mesorhabditis spiculigera]
MYFLLSLLTTSWLPVNAYLSESWSLMSSDRPNVPKCVDIPANLTLCQNMQYTQMRLPNLLDHDTLREVIDASRDWERLLQLNCHPDAQLFLCSLYAPICLDKEILPCKSLCQAVKNGCEPRMAAYGFPWPEMLSCGGYEEGDMCIKPVNSLKPTESTCAACQQVATYENLVDNFCRSSLVVKGKLGKISSNSIKVRNARSLKKGDRRRSVGETEIQLSAQGKDCPCEVLETTDKSARVLIMANRDAHGHFVANLIVPWQKEKNFKRAVHSFQRLNCHSLGREIRESARRRPHAYHLRTHELPPV